MRFLHHYQAYYCEENIWHLCHDLSAEGRHCEVLFLGNRQDQLLMWRQRGADPNAALWWDYHVVLRELDHEWIYDFDTRLSWPCHTREYLTKSFWGYEGLPEGLVPWLRLIPGEKFLREFGSNRSHMRGAKDEWLAPPPQWPALQGKGLDFQALRNMSSPKPGELLSIFDFLKRVPELS